MWKTRSVENAECGKRGVWKTRSVENEEWGKRGVGKTRSGENVATLGRHDAEKTHLIVQHPGSLTFICLNTWRGWQGVSWDHHTGCLFAASASWLWWALILRE